MDSKCFPYEWSSGAVFDHLFITEHLGAGDVARDWSMAEVVCTTSDHATLAGGKCMLSHIL